MNDSKDLKLLLAPLIRGSLFVGLCLAVAIYLALQSVKYATPMYESTAKLRLATTEAGYPGANLYKDFDYFADDQKISAEVEMLKSPLIVGQALDSVAFDKTIYRVGEIHSTELYDQSPLLIDYQTRGALLDKDFDLVVGLDGKYTLTTPLGVFEKRIGDTVLLGDGMVCIRRNLPLLMSKPNLVVADHYLFRLNSREAQLRLAQEGIDITAVDKDIPVLRITFKSPVARKAADFANALARAYVGDYIQARMKAAQTTVDFIEKQLIEVSSQLQQSENTIENYRDDKHIINIRQETETELRKISEMKIQLSNLQMNVTAMDTLEAYIRRGDDHFLELAPNFEAFTDLLSTEIIKNIQRLQGEKKELLLVYTPNHPKVKLTESKITDLTSYLKESIRNTRNNLRTKRDKIAAEIATAEKVFVGLPTREKEMRILDRDFSHNEGIYNFLTQKRTEAEIARASNIAFHRVLSEAEVPKIAVSPKKGLMVALAGFVGLLVGVAGVYLLHFMQGKVQGPEALEPLTGHAAVADIPTVKLPRDADVYRKVASRLLLMEVLKPGGQVVAFSAPHLRAGVTQTVLGLGGAMANMGFRVLLVQGDFSLERSSVAGLSEALQSLDYQAKEIQPGLFALGGGLRPGLLPNAMHTPQWLPVLETIARPYDFLLLDLPDFRKHEEALHGLRHAHVAFCLLRTGKSGNHDLETIGELMTTYHMESLQVIVNDHDTSLNPIVAMLRMLKHWREKPALFPDKA